MLKIALNAGHGINTAGKRCLKAIDKNETREWTLNSRICNLIEAGLKEYDGYELIRLDDKTGKTDVPLKQRTDKANKFGADFYLSIHHNAGVNGKSGGGIIAIVYKSIKDGTVTSRWQKSLYDEIIKTTGLKGNRSVPLQKQDLHEVRESNMPAVLLECGFMDSTVDTPIILTEDYAKKVANGVVTAIVKMGNLKKKTAVAANNVTKVPDTKSQKPKAAKKTVEELAREVIRGLWGNGNERKQRLGNAGYSYKEVQARVNEILK
ncbi:MAG: N-acetylmuramoyl-L-alanine amidase [Clostridia bacterium]|nr:N-acetylmuramoyl-L-alanine amidase [Clostridia bacterium]